MTEKQYGGSKGYGGGKIITNKNNEKMNMIKKDKKELSDSNLPTNIEDYRRAGKIASEVKDYAREITKKGVLLTETAEKIENKIIELGGQNAFPVDLSIDDIAAHYSPFYEGTDTARGLIKIDLGVHINGCICDTAFSMDLEDNEENKKLIKASEQALKEAIKTIKKDIEIREIGKRISETIKENGYTSIVNLAGHELKPYVIHAGISIPNYDNNNINKLPIGVYAIEPFATTGEGKVYDGGLSGVYGLNEIKAVRGRDEREILSYIEKEYKTLPFSSRWIIKKFGKRALIPLKFLEQQNIIRQYSHLIEKSKGKVAQSEHTIYFDGQKAEVLT
jgi:methionyl aminopeptidase